MEDCIFKRQMNAPDADDMLRFQPESENINFTQTGDEKFDDFCRAHCDMIVELKEHDSMLAFNEKLSVCAFFFSV